MVHCIVFRTFKFSSSFLADVLCGFFGLFSVFCGAGEGSLPLQVVVEQPWLLPRAGREHLVRAPLGLPGALPALAVLAAARVPEWGEGEGEFGLRGVWLTLGRAVASLARG